jgi:hypothetical protein
MMLAGWLANQRKGRPFGRGVFFSSRGRLTTNTGPQSPLTYLPPYLHPTHPTTFRTHTHTHTPRTGAVNSHPSRCECRCGPTRASCGRRAPPQSRFRSRHSAPCRSRGTRSLKISSRCLNYSRGRGSSGSREVILIAGRARASPRRGASAHRSPRQPPPQPVPPTFAFRPHAAIVYPTPRFLTPRLKPAPARMADEYCSNYPRTLVSTTGCTWFSPITLPTSQSFPLSTPQVRTPLPLMPT